MNVEITGVRSIGARSARWTLTAQQGDTQVWVVVDTSDPRFGRVVVHWVAAFDGAPVTAGLRFAAIRQVQRAAAAWRVNRQLDGIRDARRVA